MASRVDVLKMLAVTAQIFGREFSQEAAAVYASDLSEHPPDAIIAALERCRKELRQFPTIADILARIASADGRPGSEEAYAMLPQDETQSAVWTSEMADAFGIARSLSDDPVAMRMAFKEAYTRIVAEARANRLPVRWSPTLGSDKAAREQALRDAERRGRLTSKHVESLLPPAPSAIAPPEPLRLLGEDTGLEQAKAPDQIRKILDRIKPDEDKK